MLILCTNVFLFEGTVSRDLFVVLFKGTLRDVTNVNNLYQYFLFKETVSRDLFVVLFKGTLRDVTNVNNLYQNFFI